jgi:hypothetical protein
MRDRQKVQRYINNFRREITRFLRPGLGISCTVYPADAGGAILEFRMGTDIANADTYKPESATLTRALAEIRQHAFGGNLDGFIFRGTNVILENDRIILIKDDSDSEWTDAAAAKDVQEVIPATAKGTK